MFEANVIPMMAVPHPAVPVFRPLPAGSSSERGGQRFYTKTAVTFPPIEDSKVPGVCTLMRVSRWLSEPKVLLQISGKDTQKSVFVRPGKTLISHIERSG